VIVVHSVPFVRPHEHSDANATYQAGRWMNPHRNIVTSDQGRGDRLSVSAEFGHRLRCHSLLKKVGF